MKRAVWSSYAVFAVLDQLRLIQQFGQFARIVAIILIPRRGLARSDILRKIAFKKSVFSNTFRPFLSSC